MQSDWHVQALKLVSITTSLTARSVRFQLSGMNGSHNLVASLTKIMRVGRSVKTQLYK